VIEVALSTVQEGNETSRKLGTAALADPAPGAARVLEPVRSPPSREQRRLERETDVVAPDIRDAIFRRLLAVGDLTATAGALLLVGWLGGLGTSGAALATVPAIVLLAKVMGRYDHDEVVFRKSTVDELPRLLALAAAYALVWSLGGALAGYRERSGSVVEVFAAVSALLVVARVSARAFGMAVAPKERTLIIGDAAGRAYVADRLRADPSGQALIVGFLPLENERRGHKAFVHAERRIRERRVEHLRDVARELDAQRIIFIPSGEDAEPTLDAIYNAMEVGVKVSIVPRVLEVVGSSVEFDEVAGTTLLGVRRPRLSRSSTAVKRAMDIAGALVGLVLLAPLGLVVALLIKLDSPGPVFYRQDRVGRGGRLFRMIKFRSMVNGAHARRAELAELNESEGLFKVANDPRITRVGSWLRRASIDELPQLINVLRGEMALVGPRPLVPEEDEIIEGRHRNRLVLTPGMTGPWQVLGPTRAPLAEMVKIDHLYQANWSLWYDVKILLRTIAHVLARRGH
jgi:exopolysaccharide biosynthesis polyprenyl glycosylphosphotransferase